MAQLGKGKLNYRCPLCFMRDFRATRMSARSTRLCTRDSTSSILIKVVIGTLLL